MLLVAGLIRVNQASGRRISDTRLNTVREVISPVASAVFSVMHLKNGPRSGLLRRLTLIVAAVFVMFYEP